MRSSGFHSGIVCGTTAVIKILAHRDEEQRESIQNEYETMFSEKLDKRISSHVHGHLKVFSWEIFLEISEQ